MIELSVVSDILKDISRVASPTLLVPIFQPVLRLHLSSSIHTYGFGEMPKLNNDRKRRKSVSCGNWRSPRPEGTEG
jgi:hypothetical protein